MMKLFLVFKIRVVTVASNGIIFHVVLNINVVSVVSKITILCYSSLSANSVMNLVVILSLT